MSAPAEEFKPYFHLRPDAGLILVGTPVRDENGRFHLWIGGNPDWTHFEPTDLAESTYFSKSAAHPNDLSFLFVDFMLQHCRNPKALALVSAIESDLHNLGACFRKLELFHEYGKTKGHATDTRRFVITEIEYMLGVCRSLYDLHQRISEQLWSNVKLKNPLTKKQGLPDSFAKMALRGEVIRGADELKTTYGLSPHWAEFYVKEAVFFQKIRKFRNDIEHGGLTPQIIFTTPKGFAVAADSKHFSEFKTVWREGTFLPNRVAPLKPVLAHIVLETLECMGRFVQAIAKEIAFDSEIAPGYRVFIRGYYTARLAKLADYIENDPWYPEASIV
jgi:hypothetical protein